MITKEFGVNQIFAATVSGDDVTKGKPDPEPYLITCKKLAIYPNEAVVIEDSKSGVLSAKSAGCFCIGVTTTHTSNDLKLSDLVINDFSKITSTLINSLAT